MSTLARPSGVDTARFLVAVGGAFAVFVLAYAKGVPIVLALCAIVGSTLIAWHSPAAALSVFFFCLLAVDRDIQEMLPDHWKMISIGGAELRYSDPMLAAMSLSAGIRGYGIMVTRIRRFDVVEVLTWAFVAVLAAYSAMGVSTHGIASPGEMRTYYGVVLVVAYILISVRSSSDALRCWNHLYWLGLSLIAVSIWRGWALHRLAIGPDTRWITAHSNLALNLACVVPLFVPREGQSGHRPWTAWLVGALALIMTLTNPHRSVWLATSMAIATILASGGFSVRRFASYTMILAVAAMCSTFLVTAAGLDVAAFVAERLTPFTSGFYYDPNSAWRVSLWLKAMLQVDSAGAWVFGLGFGRHFGIVDFAGDIIRTSPHNAYITAYYHMGFFGLGLSLIWLGALTLRRDVLRDPSGVLALATLAACMGFSVAYPFPVFGLALVAVASVGVTRTRREASVDPARWTPDPFGRLGHLTQATRVRGDSND